MKDILKIIRLIKPYYGWAAVNVASNIMVAIFTVISIPALIPFFRILFGLDDERPPYPGDHLTSSNFLEYIKYGIYQLVETHGQQTVMAWLCISLVVIFMLKNLFKYISLVAMAPIRNGIVRDLRAKLMSKLLILPVGFFSDEKKGNLISRFSGDATELEWSILNVLEALFRSPLVMLGSLGYMLYVSPLLTLYVILLVGGLAIVMMAIGRTLKKRSYRAQSKLGGILSHVEETISGQKVIKAFNAEKYVYQKFHSDNNQFKSLMDRIYWRRDLASPLSEFFGVSVLAALLWFGSKAIFEEGVDPSFFLTFLFAFYNVIEPAKQFTNASFNVRKGMAALQRIEEILLTEVHIKEAPKPHTISGFKTGITFDNVHFRYKDTTESVLKNIRLEIRKGEKLAVVGPSGSGKSTLVDLLPRFYDVESGSITIDGVDIKDCTLVSLRSLFGIVTQDPILFNDTIYNNIVFGKEGVTPQEVEHAAQMAFAHEFILQTTSGYETIIGDRGVKLSGGQRQRITIARALLKDPPVFIMDEATSSLDTASEKVVQDAIDKAMENRTAIIIAHRLSTVREVDRIIVLHEGRIVEEGTHDQLLQLNGYYKHLATSQELQ